MSLQRRKRIDRAWEKVKRAGKKKGWKIAPVHGDHRIAMAYLMTACLVAKGNWPLSKQIVIPDNVSCIETSQPLDEFIDTLLLINGEG